MPFNFYDTHTLIMAVEGLNPAHSFLRDRYFPTNAATDIFSTTDVLAEFRDGTKKLAPFVAPRKGGVTIARAGYTMERYTPPTIAPKRMLTIDDLNKRGFGEALFSQLTPEQRQQALLLRDAGELSNYITRREEAMAAEVMLSNGCIMKHIADDEQNGDEMHIIFGNKDDAVYTPTVDWNNEDADILGDLGAMVRMLTSRGLPVSDVVCPPDVADAILNNKKIKELLDIKNYNVGSVEPIELPNGASRVAVLNVKGRNLNVICYEETYTDDDGNDVQYIPAGKIVLTAPAAGRTLYGAVSQVEQADGQFHTYTGKRIPKYISSAEGNSRSLTITSSPILMPKHKNAFITATVIGG